MGLTTWNTVCGSLSYADKSNSVSFTAKALAYLKRNPWPKFQQRRFSDLPPELIHQIMSYLYEQDCRQLGLSSRMLREASVLHVYDVSVPRRVI